MLLRILVVKEATPILPGPMCHQSHSKTLSWGMPKIPHAQSLAWVSSPQCQLHSRQAVPTRSSCPSVTVTRMAQIPALPPISNGSQRRTPQTSFTRLPVKGQDVRPQHSSAKAPPQPITLHSLTPSWATVSLVPLNTGCDLLSGRCALILAN